MFEKNTEAIGLEIGDGLVKALYVQSTPKTNKLIDFTMVDVNFRDGRQGIVNAIKEVMNRLPLKQKNKTKINISVSGESVMVRDIHWPQMSDEEIRKALKFEVERQVHYKTDEIVFDYYSVMDKSIAETKTRVILVAAKKDLIENYVSLVESAGYGCGFVEVDTFSLLNCFYVNGPKLPPEKTVAIINVGLEVTNIDIIKGKIVGLTKDAFVAWSNLIDAVPPEMELDFDNVNKLKGLFGSDDIYELSLFIMNALSNQIRRTLEFYESQGRDTVEEIYLSGKIAMYKNMDKYLQNILGLKVTIWNPLSAIECDPKLAEKHKIKERSLMLALCAGLACHRCFDINLSSKKTAPKKSNKTLQVLLRHKMLAAGAVLVIFVLLGIWVILASQLKAKEAYKQKLLTENARLKAVLQDIEELKKGRALLSEHMQVARVLLSRQFLWSRKLYEISKNIPEDVWLTDVYIKGVVPETAKGGKENIFGWKPSSGGAQEKTKTPEQQVLFINGVAYSLVNNSMLSMVNDFINNLKKDSDFMKDFTKVELNRSYRETIGDKPVMRFEIQCFLK
jgi:type IV pilus assembly protein PilM